MKNGIHKILLLLFLLCNIYWAFAQPSETIISGTVKDSLNQSIPNAMVVLIRIKDQAGLEFATTDQKGMYHLVCKNEYFKNQLTIKAAAAGFLKQEQSVNINTKKINFVLASSINAVTLPTVEVKNRTRAVVQKSDTLSYDAASFTEKSDRYLGDIIKKLPGIEVDDNGIIKYKGKAINKFYIEGDNLLDDRYSIATDKLNIEHVDKVQVIEHNQHIKMLHGIVPSDRAGINIRLKNKSKVNFINNAELTGGLPNMYAVDAKSMAFKKKFKTLNAIKLTSTGKPFENTNNAAPYNASKQLEINTLYKLTPDIGLKLNGWYGADKQYSINRLRNIYFLPQNDTIQYTEENDTRFKTDALNLQLHFDANTSKNYLNNTTAFMRKQAYNTIATLANDNLILQQTDNSENTLSNAFSGYLLIKKKHILNYENVLNYTNNPQLRYFTPGALPDIVNDSIAYAKTNQTFRLTNFSVHNKISYNRVLNKWTAGFDFGFHYQNQQLNSRVVMLQQNGNNTMPLGFSNAISWVKSEWFSTANITYKGNRSQLILGIPLKWIQYKYDNDSVFQNKDAGSRFNYEPSLSWELKAGRENTINLEYSLNYKTAGIVDIYGGSVFSSYRSVNSFETPFLMSRSHAIGLGFHYKRVIKALFASIDFNYAPTKYYFLYQTTLQNNLTKIVALPTANYGSIAAATGKVSKYIFSLNTTIALNSGLKYISAQQMQNDFLFKTTTQVKNAEIKITPTVLKWLKADVSYGYVQYNTHASQSGFKTQQVHQHKLASAFIFYPTDDWSIHINGNYNRFVQDNNSVNANLLLDGYIQYKFSKPKLLLRLNCSNIADIRKLETISSNSNIIITQSNYIAYGVVRLLVKRGCLKRTSFFFDYSQM